EKERDRGGQAFEFGSLEDTGVDGQVRCDVYLKRYDAATVNIYESTDKDRQRASGDQKNMHESVSIKGLARVHG
ncbi:MAG TPA: hypothetical protein VNA86_08010, partial [bacterium]|nr:hypothetical protein [bacterium]